MELIGKIVRLRAIELEDMEYLKKMINDPSIEKMTVGGSFPVSHIKQKEWFMNRKEQLDLRYMIEILDGKTIGMIGLTEIDYKNRRASIFYKTLAEKEDRVKGDTFESCILLLKYAFEEMNLHMVVGTILEYNSFSNRLLMKCGFTKDGVLRERIFKQGAYQNLVEWSLLRSEFPEVYARYLN